MDQRAWNERTRRLPEESYLQARTGPGGSGCGHDEAGWGRRRRPLLGAFDRSGTWLDVGCANGYLLETLPTWVARRGFTLEPFGLELIPSVADLARTRLPHLAERIYTGDVTEWDPPRRWSFVTVLTEAVPPSGGTGLVHHLLERFAEPGGRVIISSFGSSRRREPAEAVAERLVADGFEVPGSAQAIVSGIIVTQTAWIAAMVLYVGPAPLVPALNSYWLKIHVIAAILGSSLFALGGVMTILYLIKDRAEVWRVLPPIMGGSVEMDAAPPHFASGADEAVPSSPRSRRGILPTASTLDRIAYQTIAFAFQVWTFAVIAGAIWAEEAWGRYWGWDPKEVWSFVTWTIFAGYLHARATAGWKGRKAAVIALIRFVSLLITYYAVNLWIVGLHSYKGF